MNVYSTNNKTLQISLKDAVLQALPSDNGLYMLERITKLPQTFFDNITTFTFPELAFMVARNLIGTAVPDPDLKAIVDRSITFDAPLVQLDKQLHILELFHGPTLAFKDFGARFMASLMSYFVRNDTKKLTILVATSGDTGGAVAHGFFQTEGIEVIILYPSGKVSPLQEKQLTTLGSNISALEIEGTFDDCQAMVKQAFLDKDLNEQIRLTSANSINIARLIPQSFYYFRAYQQLPQSSKEAVFVVPSGNFGNLTAGLIARRMGMPVKQFVAATNLNDVVPEYLYSGTYSPRSSVPTLSNAMDVGNPSNFARMLDLYESQFSSMSQEIEGYAFSDLSTQEGMREVYSKYKYVIDPHGAVGYLAFREHLARHADQVGVLLATAHPAKFVEVVQQTMGLQVEVPERLAALAKLPKEATQLPASFDALKEHLMNRAE